MMDDQNLELNLTQFNLIKFVGKIEQKLSGLIREGKVEIHSNISDEEAAIYADERKFEEIITYLGGQILKLAGTDQFHIRFKLRESGEAVQVEVENLDVQLSEDAEARLRKIFEAGQSVAQRIVQQHQGRLWADSSNGISFIFTVPIAADVPYAGLKSSENQASQDKQDMM